MERERRDGHGRHTRRVVVGWIVVLMAALPVAISCTSCASEVERGHASVEGWVLGAAAARPGGDPGASWSVGLDGGAGSGAWSVRLHGAGAAGIVPGHQVAREHPVLAGEVVWEGVARRLRLGYAAGDGYPPFDGPLRLVDGGVYGSGSRAWWAQGGRAGAGVTLMRGLGIPLWYVHGRWVEGEVWAGQAQAGPLSAQAVLAETGEQRLRFAGGKEIPVRRADAALLAHWSGHAQRARLTIQAAVSDHRARDGWDVRRTGGWASAIEATRWGAWRVELTAVSPSFDVPTWGEGAPASGKVRIEGRLSGRGREAGTRAWGSAHVTFPWEGGAAAYRVDAGYRWDRPGGRPVRVEGGVASDGDGVGPIFSVTAGDPPSGTGWSASRGVTGETLMSSWITWTPGVRMAASWAPSSGAIRLEASGGPAAEAFDPGWPPAGWRVVCRWPARGEPFPLTYAEGGWQLAPGWSVGGRMGRWDQGRLDVSVEGPWSFLIMVRREW